jgi:hypothetical protein
MPSAPAGGAGEAQDVESWGEGQDGGEDRDEGAVTSYEVLMSQVQYVPGQPCDTSRMLERKSYEQWLASRRIVPANPEDSFRRTITAHVTGTKKRRPFPVEVEEDLLKRMRSKTTWPCFLGFKDAKGADLTIGRTGFRATGWNEQRRSLRHRQEQFQQQEQQQYSSLQYLPEVTLQSQAHPGLPVPPVAYYSGGEYKLHQHPNYQPPPPPQKQQQQQQQQHDDLLGEAIAQGDPDSGARFMPFEDSLRPISLVPGSWEGDPDVLEGDAVFMNMLTTLLGVQQQESGGGGGSQLFELLDDDETSTTASEWAGASDASSEHGDTGRLQQALHAAPLLLGGVKRRAGDEVEQEQLDEQGRRRGSSSAASANSDLDQFPTSAHELNKRVSAPGKKRGKMVRRRSSLAVSKDTVSQMLVVAEHDPSRRAQIEANRAAWEDDPDMLQFVLDQFGVQSSDFVVVAGAGARAGADAGDREVDEVAAALASAGVDSDAVVVRSDSLPAGLAALRRNCQPTTMRGSIARILFMSTSPRLVRETFEAGYRMGEHVIGPGVRAGLQRSTSEIATDPRFSPQFNFVNNEEERVFDPSRPIGHSVIDARSGVYLGCDRAAKDIMRGDLTGLSTSSVIRSKLTYWLNVRHIAPALMLHGEVFYRTHSVKLDGTPCIIKMHYKLQGVKIFSTFQEVTMDYPSIMDLPPLNA